MIVFKNKYITNKFSSLNFHVLTNQLTSLIIRSINHEPVHSLVGKVIKYNFCILILIQ
jgi:hypothetical protein